LIPLSAHLALSAPFAALAGERLHVIEHAVNETTTHVGAGAKGDSAGDLLTWRACAATAAGRRQAAAAHS